MALAMVGLVGVIGAAGCGSSGRDSSSESGGQGDAQLGRPGGTNQQPGQGGTQLSGSGEDDQQADKPTGQDLSAQERHVVRTATMSVRVDDVTAAAAQARGVAERFGGFVAAEQTESDAASMTLRVAADQLDDALTAIDELGDVTRREQQAEDVTEQVVDVEARIANQRASVERVRALLGQANSVGDVMQVEAELTTRQAELESLENRRAALASQTELATVTVRLAGRGSPVLDDERTGFLAGLKSGWSALVATVSVLLTMLGAVLPFALAIGLPLLAVLWIVRRRRPVAALAPTGLGSGAEPSASGSGPTGGWEVRERD